MFGQKLNRRYGISFGDGARLNAWFGQKRTGTSGIAAASLHNVNHTGALQYVGNRQVLGSHPVSSGSVPVRFGETLASLPNLSYK